MYQPGQALRNLADPVVQHSQCAGVTCGGCLKDRAAVGGDQAHLLGTAHQRCRGGVPLITADGTAGACHAVQRVQAEMSQLTAKAPRTLQQTAAGDDAAAHAGA